MRVTKAREHLTAEELRKMLSEEKAEWRRKRIQVIQIALVKPMKAKEIGKIVGFSKSHVNHLVAAYNRLGAQVLKTKGKGGWTYGHMTPKQENLFFKKMESEATKGFYSSAKEIKEKYERKIGKSIGNSTIYTILYRHNWKKQTPRPYHPQKNVAAQKAFKKTLNLPFVKLQNKKMLKISLF